MITQKSLLLLSLALGTTSLLAACGDDEPGGTIDANDHDAAGDPPDSMPPTATRSMTLAVTDVSLTSVDGEEAGIRGGAVSLEVSDLTQGGGEIIFGTSTTGGCVVQRFDATHTARPVVDAGTITISGNGLLKPVGPCSFIGGAYRCISAAATGQTSTATATGVNGAVVYSFPGQNFTGDLVGAYLSANGFATNATFNSGASAFPIIAHSATTLTVINPAGTGAPDTTDTAVNFSVLNGVGPIPTPPAGTNTFLGEATQMVTISKPADDDWGAVNFTTYVRGAGFTLATASAEPHEFPFTAADVTFTCMGAGGECGGDGTGGLKALIVSGKTTDAPISNDARDFEMPAPVTAYTTFQCGFIVPDHTGTIPEAAVTAILSTNPTRIETRVLRVAGTQVMDGEDGLNKGNIVVGHGLVGHTTAP